MHVFKYMVPGLRPGMREHRKDMAHLWILFGSCMLNLGLNAIETIERPYMRLVPTWGGIFGAELTNMFIQWLALSGRAVPFVVTQLRKLTRILT